MSLILLQVFGCANPVPKQDEMQAMVLLQSRAGHYLSAQKADGQNVADARYFMLQPGQHKLQVRLGYERKGKAGGTALRYCLAEIDYADFAAGQQYSIRAIAMGYTVRVWLFDDQGKRLKESRFVRCGAQY